MCPEPIKLTIEVSAKIPEPCPSGLRDTLASDKAGDHLYDCLCDWLWRYVPAELTCFDLAVGVTATQ